MTTLNTLLIKKRMEENGISINDFSIIMNTNESRIRSWLENESEPRLYNLKKICQVLDLRINEVIPDRIKLTFGRIEANILKHKPDFPINNADMKAMINGMMDSINEIL